MIGSGIPINQRSAPFPKPMISLHLLCREDARRSRVVPAFQTFPAGVPDRFRRQVDRDLAAEFGECGTMGFVPPFRPAARATAERTWFAAISCFFRCVAPARVPCGH